MKRALNCIALAMLAATTQVAGVAYAESPKAPAAPAVQSAPAVSMTPIAANSPDDWVVYDDVTVTSEVDKVTSHLMATRKAVEANDSKKAAAELRAVATELKAQSGMAATIDNARTQAETKLAQDIARRLQATAREVDDAAAALESGKIKTEAELDKVMDMAARANMDRRWEVTDVATRYSLSEEPQRQFTHAMAAYKKNDYKAAAGSIRQATNFVHFEARSATGDVRQALDRSVTELDQLAISMEKGEVSDEKLMEDEFARASHALALEHQSKAAESWSRKEYHQVGDEFRAAAHGLESAAGWAGEEAKAGASAVAADTRAIGEKIASGAAWTRDEVVMGFKSLGNAIDALGQKIGSTAKGSR